MNVQTSIYLRSALIMVSVALLLACDPHSPASNARSRDSSIASVPPALAQNPSPTSFVAEGLDQLADESLSDWVSYADAVVRATVVAETELPAPPEVAERKEGYVGRAIELRVDEPVVDG